MSTRYTHIVTLVLYSVESCRHLRVFFKFDMDSTVHFCTPILMSVTPDTNTTVDTSCADGDVRLVGGVNELEGQVEMCYNKFWGSVCHSFWHTADANVVCEQLGHQPTGANKIILNLS